MIKQRKKSGISSKDAQDMGYSQVFGMPGIAFAKAGRMFNGALIEVDDKGNPLEKPFIEPAAVEPEVVAEAAAVESVTVAADVEPVAAAPAADPAPAVEPDADVAKPAGESEMLAELRAKISAADADLKGWTADNDATTPEGKKEYAKIYGRVRRAKDAFVKAGGKLD